MAPVFIVIILVELIGRIFDPAGISYYPEMSSHLDTMIIEVPTGYRNRPGLEGDFFRIGAQRFYRIVATRYISINLPDSNQIPARAEK